MFNSPELDAVKDRYYSEEQRPSISTVMYLRDMEKNEAEERAKEVIVKRKKKLEDEERLRIYNEEQARLKAIQQARDALPYSDPLAQEICERIAVGELLINVCIDERFPSMRRCNHWMRECPEFNTLYQSAINDRLNVFEEEVVKIADDMRNDFRTVIKNGVEKRVADPEMVARAKLRIDVRFRHLKALRPARWSDTSTLQVKNVDEFDPANFSTEQLEREIADIEAKSRVSRLVA